VDSQPKITTTDELHRYLHLAMQLEHATIPPYLTALYSIQAGSNSDAFHVIRVVVVEEMLHLTLATNILNAVGGTPDLTQPGFVPAYPAYLPDGETDFQVDLQAFGREAIETFLKIERPRRAPDEESRLVRREPGDARQRFATTPGDGAMQYYSIGEFYDEIDRGLCYLHERDGDSLFAGDPGLQVTPEYYYSGGGDVIPVTDLESARAAIRLIAEQGEGLGGRIYDTEDELAHFYRFKQLQLGRYYQAGDTPDEPTGPPLEVGWNAVYPIKRNARLSDYPAGSELHAAAVDFNAAYADFLGLLTSAFTGRPELLVEAVPEMFRLREKMCRLIHNPLPGADPVNAAPTFETDAVAGRVRS
jgi:ferritin-like protein